MSDFQTLIDANHWDGVLKELSTSSEDNRMALCQYFMKNPHQNYDHGLIVKFFDWICPVKFAYNAFGMHNTFDQYILHYAIEEGDVPMIQKIVKERPNVLEADGAFGWFEYLTCAVQNFTSILLDQSQCLAVLKELLVHFKDSQCRALSEAIKNNHPQVFDMVLPRANLRYNHSYILCQALLEDNEHYSTMILRENQCLLTDAMYSLKYGDIIHEYKYTKERISKADEFLLRQINQEHPSFSIQYISCQLWKAVASENITEINNWLDNCSDQSVIYTFACSTLAHKKADLAMPFLHKLDCVKSRVGMKMMNVVSHDNFVLLASKMSEQTLEKMLVGCVYQNDFYYASFLNDYAKLEHRHQDILSVFIKRTKFLLGVNTDMVERFQSWLAAWECEKALSCIESVASSKDKKKI